MTQTKKTPAAAPDRDTRNGPAIWAENTPDARAIAKHLADRHGLRPAPSLPAPTGIDRAAEVPVLVILAPSPAVLFAAIMERAETPEAAREMWRERVSAWLALNRRNRRAVLVADPADIRAHPGAFLRRLNLPDTAEARAALTGAAPDTSEAESADPVRRILAQHALEADLRCRTLAGELDAVRLPLSGTAPADPATAAFAADRRRQDERRERDLLQAQQKSLYEQTEALYREKLQAEQRLKQLQGGLDSQEAQIGKLEAELAGLRHRLAGKEQALQAAGALLRDLDQVRARLDDRIAELERRGADQAAALAERSTEAATLQGELDRILSSRSYRLTAPLRRLRGLFGRGGR